MRALRDRSLAARPGVIRPLARAAALAALVAGAATLQAGRLPDTEATLILPEGMLVTVERATFFQDGGLMELRVRNSTYEVTRAVVRIAVFDERLRFKGSVRYCTGVLQPGTRQPLLIPLEVKGADVRDSFVVLIEEVLTPRRRYALRETLREALAEARKALDRRGWDLTTVEEPRSGPIPDCPCDCADAEQVARDTCGEAGPEAFTCTPMPPGCSAGLSCKR